MQVSTPAPLLVDAHVHFHQCFDQDRFLDAALANFRQGAADLGFGEGFLGCLLLAEIASAHWFDSLRSDGGSGAWSFEPTGEPSALFARRENGGERLLVIAGRQVRSREGLEVLALASSEEFPDGLPFGDALARVRWSGAVPVLPWGFGKWWLYRGGLVEAVIRRPDPKWILLGDNAGRPRAGGIPRLFREAEARGIPVLPGSDPLPLPEHVTRAGSYGFVLDGGLDERRPAEGLRRWLRGLSGQPRVFGRSEGLAGFCRDQALLRLRRPVRIPSPARSPAQTGRSAAASPWIP